MREQMPTTRLVTNKIHTGDCLRILANMPPRSVDLAFADPPFNIGYEYDKYHDDREKDDYLSWTKEWLKAVKRVLKPSGSFYVAIGDEYAAEIKVRMDELGFNLRNWIIWHYTFGVHCKRKFTRSHAHIFYYTMDPETFTFNDMDIRVPSARQMLYADKRANPAGRIPDDTWVLQPEEENPKANGKLKSGTRYPTWLLRPQDDERPEGKGAFEADSDTWYLSRVCGTFKERVDHPCQMPESVLERIIKVSSNEGDTVLDPFGGSGTTLVAAKRLGRQYLGIELSKEYAAQIRKRLKAIPAPQAKTRVRAKGA